jgi:hypothetical protein
VSWAKEARRKLGNQPIWQKSVISQKPKNHGETYTQPGTEKKGKLK